MTRHLLALACAAALLTACGGSDTPASATTAPSPTPTAGPDAETRAPGDRDAAFVTTELASFDEPWAGAFLPDGRVLVTEKAGTLKLFNPDTGETGEIAGLPEVAYGRQGGLGDVLPHPDFASNGLLYFSYAEAGEGGSGAVVARATLTLEGDGGQLGDVETIWRQVPLFSGQGHYAYRLAFDPEGYLWITSGERQQFDPAQDLTSNAGKIIRLNADGSVPADNPFADQGGVTAQIWSYGHRNPLGIAFAPDGRLWVQEMGPAGGDELNLIEKGGNYGYPIVSDGNHYNGDPIPDHSTRPEFIPPVISWTPVISPAGLLIYTGDLFPQWQGSGFIGGLSSKSLVRIAFDGDSAREAERFDMGERIRDVFQGPDGAIWLLEDGEDGRLLKLTPPA